MDEICIEKLKEDYKVCIANFLNENRTDKDGILINSDGSLKFWNCVSVKNAENSILWTSINPSDHGDTNENHFNMSWDEVINGISTPKEKRGYWGELLSKIAGLTDICGHMDLIPIHITKENKLKARFFTADNTPSRMFIAELVTISQNFIENLRPKLIIHSNVQSSFLWGLCKDKGWMGYTLQPVSLVSEIFSGRITYTKRQNSLFRITGVSDNSFIKTTNLKGTFLLIDYQVARPEFREKSLKHDDVLNIWNELKEK